MDITTFIKKHDYILCIDSDGTALDTMTIKHEKCFGPCFVEEWGLQKISHQALKRWNEINLYEQTRGKNRFITLQLILLEYNGKYLKIDGLEHFSDWISNSKELSNNSLKEKILNAESEIFNKVLTWSENVNKAIAKLTFDDKRPFGRVKEFFEFARGKVDLAVVSSADAKSLNEEWEHFGLSAYVDVMTNQEVGTKIQCINMLIDKGYKSQNILMIGDSPPDINAANQTGIYFYPILTNNQAICWENLKKIYLQDFLNGNYAKNEEIQKQLFYNQFNK